MSQLTQLTQSETFVRQQHRRHATRNILAAGLALVSQLAHLWALPDLYVLWPAHGLFVLCAAIGQGLLAPSLLFGPGHMARRVGLLLNLLIVAGWLLTRIVGIPAYVTFVQQPVDAPGLIAVGSALALGVVLLTTPSRRRPLTQATS